VIMSESFFRGYLLAYTLWLGVALGALAMGMIHNLTGGKWGDAIRRHIEAAMKMIPLCAVMFIPIAIGAPSMYHWAAAGATADPILAHKAAYLNLPFFYVRAVVYFASWIWLAKMTSRQYDVKRAEKMSGPGLVLYTFTMTFASFDWMMSLDPHWFSTMYGPLVMVSQILTAFAFLIPRALKRDKIAPGDMHDLGKLLFAFVVLWAYLSFSQFLITWSGNLPEEIPWFHKRMHGGWDTLGVMLMVLHFAFPFFILLSKSVKRNPKLLAMMATFILLVRCLDIFWLIAPEFAHGGGIRVGLWDVILPIVLGFIWVTFFNKEVESWKSHAATT